MAETASPKSLPWLICAAVTSSSSALATPTNRSLANCSFCSNQLLLLAFNLISVIATKKRQQLNHQTPSLLFVQQKCSNKGLETYQLCMDTVKSPCRRQLTLLGAHPRTPSNSLASNPASTREASFLGRGCLSPPKYRI